MAAWRCGNNLALKLRMTIQSISTKVVSGFAHLSGLALMGATFGVVIGCPYSDEIRDAGSWLGAALVAGLTVYVVYQTITRFKTIFNAVLSQIYRFAKIPGNFIQAVNSYWPRIWSAETGNAHNLRLPPDIFFARKMIE